MPNEHACRLEDPSSFQRFARSNKTRPHRIYGFGKGGSKIQAYRYPTDSWSEAAARSHCKEHGGSFEAASGTKEAYNGKGAMIAWYPPEDVAKQLAVEGGEAPEELHLTLGFFPDAEALDREQVGDCMRRACQDGGPLEGTVGGIGRFTGSPTSDGKDVLYASVDAPRLEEFRQSLVEDLELAGFPISKEHGFTPHMTLAYLDPEAASPVSRLDPVPITIDSIVLASSDEKLLVERIGQTEERVGIEDMEARLAVGPATLAEIMKSAKFPFLVVPLSGADTREVIVRRGSEWYAVDRRTGKTLSRSMTYTGLLRTLRKQ